MDLILSKKLIRQTIIEGMKVPKWRNLAPLEHTFHCLKVLSALESYTCPKTLRMLDGHGV